MVKRLLDKGYLCNIHVLQNGMKDNIKNLTFISKPSRTVHIKYTKLLTVPYDCILSTNQGLITKKQALELGIGGILLLKIHV